VRWDETGKWFWAKCIGFDQERVEHTIEYDNGSMEHLVLADVTWKKKPEDQVMEEIVVEEEDGVEVEEVEAELEVEEQSKMEDGNADYFDEQEPMVADNDNEADCGDQEQNHWQVEGVAAGSFSSSIAAIVSCVGQWGLTHHHNEQDQQEQVEEGVAAGRYAGAIAAFAAYMGERGAPRYQQDLEMEEAGAETIKATDEEEGERYSRRQPLDQVEQREVRKALGRGGDDDERVVHTYANDVDARRISLKRSDMRTLIETQWLNDEVINAWMMLLQCRTELTTARVHIFSSHFYNQLQGREFDAEVVSGYTHTLDLFTKDKVIVPVNISNQHWVLCVIYMTKKTIECYDSLGVGGGHDIAQHLLDYVKGELKSKKGEDLDEAEWTLNCAQADTPQQTNSDDCGVFTCIAADYIAADEPLCYSQFDMPHFRQRIAFCLLRASLQHEHQV
jgi:hypothetical protein